VSKNCDVVGRCVVVKFGGSSLADGDKVSRAARAVVEELKRGTRIVVVVSAVGKTTDFLINLTSQAVKGSVIPGNDIDEVLSMGERTSARIFSAALKANGVKCRYFDPADPDWPIITNNKPTNADPILSICKKRIRRYVLPVLKNRAVAVIPGFIGRTENGLITTMGRGGSDTTALIVAHALEAKEVILVTDVDGIMTADPKIVKSAKKLDEIDVNSLIGIADSGTKFIHKKALKYKDRDIDVRVINHKHCSLRAEGTRIHGSLESDLKVHLAYPEAAISVTIVGKALSESPQVLHQIMQQMKDANVPILGVSANHDSIILYLPERSGEKTLEQLHFVVTSNPQALAMAVRKNIALINVKGVGLEETPGIINKISEALYSKNINIFGMFTLTSNVQFFVDKNDVDNALTAIKDSIGGRLEMNSLKLRVQLTERVENK